MPEQPYLFSGPVWLEVKDGNPTAMSIFKRHYTARESRKIEQCVGPGFKLLLITPDARALFAWRKFISDADEQGINCAIFRNEGAGLSSTLIRAASSIALEHWPGERLYTYVDPTKIRHKRDPGRCFLKAGWSKCGYQTASGKLVFEFVPLPS